MIEGVHEAKIQVKYACTGCGKTFAEHNKVLRHIDDMHGVDKEEKRNTYKFQCNNCGRRFLTKQIMSRHMHQHDKPPKKPGYVCKICETQCPTPSKLVRHETRIHKEMGKNSSQQKMGTTELKCTTTFNGDSFLNRDSPTFLSDPGKPGVQSKGLSVSATVQQLVEHLLR